MSVRLVVHYRMLVVLQVEKKFLCRGSPLQCHPAVLVFHVLHVLWLDFESQFLADFFRNVSSCQLAVLAQTANALL